MELMQLFKRLGLQDKEPEVYLALIRLSGTQPASVVAQHTGLNRTTVYKTLIRLAHIGLVTKTMKHGILCFYAEEPPVRLESVLMNQKKQLEKIHEDLMGAIPKFNELQRHELIFPKMRYYEGAEGVKRVYEDTLLEGQPIYAFENLETMAPEIKDWVFNNYVPRRVEKNISFKLIAPKNKEHIAFRKRDKASLRESRFFTPDLFPMEIEINIYGNKTAFFSYKAQEMFGVILESQSIATSMKAIFNFCWQTSK